MSFIQNEDLHDLLHSLSIITELPACIYDASYELVKGFNSVNRTDFCRQMMKIPEFQQKCLECDIASLKRSQQTKNINIYRCHAGLIEVTTPIINNDVVCGYLMIGQMTDISNKEELANHIITHCSSYADCKTLTKLSKGIKYKSGEQIFAISKLVDICAKHIQLKALIRPSNEDFLPLLESYVDDHLTETLTVEFLCNKFNTSRTQLYAAFATKVRGGLAAFIKDKRLQTAKMLLKTTDFSIAEVMKRTGFSSLNYFSKAFKKKYGMTPRRFKIKSAEAENTEM